MYLLLMLAKDNQGGESLYHLQDPLVSVVSNPLDHIYPEGVHELIVGLSQNLACCLCQTQDQVVTVKEESLFCVNLDEPQSDFKIGFSVEARERNKKYTM